MEKLSATLSAVRNLRTSVRSCFEKLSEGISEDGLPKDESNELFIQIFQEHFNDVNNQLRYSIQYILILG